MRRGQARRARARKIERFFSQPFFVAEQFTGLRSLNVTLAETIRSCKEIAPDGEWDHLPEGAFYMKGDIDEVVEAAERQAAEA